MACIPAAARAAGFFWQAVATSPRKTRQAIPKVRFKVFFLTRSFFCPASYCLEIWLFLKGFLVAAPMGGRQIWLPRAGTILQRCQPAEMQCSGFSTILTPRVAPLTQK
jgi:hypothetical protein